MYYINTGRFQGTSTTTLTTAQERWPLRLFLRAAAGDLYIASELLSAVIVASDRVVRNDTDIQLTPGNAKRS